MPEKLTPMAPNFNTNTIKNARLQNLIYRLGRTDVPPHYYMNTVPGVNEMTNQLAMRGGFPQQERMVRDKRKSLDRATLYSYQAARIKKCLPPRLKDEDNYPLVRALINPDKNKFDYDNKIVSVGFEYDFHPGDVFEWARTNSYWLITLQDLDEIAYFRGEIRRCDYILNWLDEDGNMQSSYVSVRGPVETKINFIQKHGISVDEPNHSLHIYMPRTEAACKYFKRYAKFYLSSADFPVDQICWRVEAVDAVSTVGILELNAVEYYSNKDEDDVDAGIVGAHIQKIEIPAQNEDSAIIGETFIRPKVEYVYYINTHKDGYWYLGETKVPVQLDAFVNDKNYSAVRIKWNSSYSGQFDLYYKCLVGEEITSKTIVVESLF